MLAAMLIAAATAQPSDWYAEPVASSLHPVREPFLHRWQDNVTAVMSGSGASPLFRNTSAQMDAYWRLTANDTTRPWISEEEEQQAMQQAGLGALLALQLSANQIISRSPEFSTIQRGLRTLGGPSLVIEEKREGVKVSLNEGPKNQRVAMASIEEPRQPDRSRDILPRQPPTRMRLSSGLRVIDITRTAESGEEYTILRPGLSLSAEADNLGPVSLRLQTALVQERPRQPSVDWRAAVRLSTLPGVALVGDIQGDEQLPSRLQTGVEWRIPAEVVLTTRLMGSYRVEDGEERLMLQLTRPMRWNIPNDMQRWPLGQELDGRGPEPVLRREVGPGELISLVPADVAQEAIARQRQAQDSAGDIALRDGGS
jgi:hypothetical protein